MCINCKLKSKGYNLEKIMAKADTAFNELPEMFGGIEQGYRDNMAAWVKSNRVLFIAIGFVVICNLLSMPFGYPKVFLVTSVAMPMLTLLLGREMLKRKRIQERRAFEIGKLSMNLAIQHAYIDAFGSDHEN